MNAIIRLDEDVDDIDLIQSYHKMNALLPFTAGLYMVFTLSLTLNTNQHSSKKLQSCFLAQLSINWLNMAKVGVLRDLFNLVTM